MCGRYTSTTTAGDLASYFHVDDVVGAAPGPRWNVAPTDEVWLVVERDRRRQLQRARWGLVPPWAPTSNGAGRRINARAETVFDRSAYRHAFTAGRRCLLPADGFYEWRGGQAWHVRRRGGGVLAFAGLWERWRPAPGADGDRSHEVITCSIMTTGASEDVAAVHDRMPALLPPSTWGAWLDRSGGDPLGLQALLRPAPAGTLELVPVGPRVGNVANDDAGLIEPVAAAPTPGAGQLKGQLGLFPP